MPTAILAAGTASQQVTGIREDLTDILTNISPTETPFLSSIGRTTANGILHEWQTITLEAAVSSNAAVEGASCTPVSGNVGTRVQNYTQIFTKNVRLSNTLLGVRTAGRSNEWELQMDIKAKSLARDMEFSLCAQSAIAAGDVSGDAAKILEGLGVVASAGGFLSGNVESLLTTAADIATRKNLSETDFNDLLQTVWTAGGNPDTIHCGGYLRRVISGFSANATRMSSVDFGDMILNASVSVYQSDFGQVRIVTNRYCGVGTIGATLAAIETQYFKLAELRGLTFTKLAKDGDRELGQFIIEATLAAYAPTSSGKLIGAASAVGATT